jgi:hypothetical protein
MIGKSLTDSEVLEILYKSEESFSDSVSSSDNDTDDITLADVIINDDGVMKSIYCTDISGGRLWIITEDYNLNMGELI